MPFADPLTKARWQKDYNKRWYRANRVTRNLIARNVTNRRKLRQTKRQWVLDQCGHSCTNCGNPSMALEISDPRRARDLEGKSVMDYSWEDLQAVHSRLILRCPECS